MQTLEIKNFVTIKSAKIELKPFVVVIGPQASGKSLVAKIAYFIKEFLFLDFINALQNQTTWKKFQEEEEIKKFLTIFPDYIWKKDPFEIIFKSNESYIKIYNDLSDLKIECSNDIEAKYKNIRKEFKEEYNHENQTEPSKNILTTKNKLTIFRKIFAANISDSKDLFSQALFIPAGRAFFSNIRRNIFSFLSKEIEIDYFLKEFGSILENVKDVYEHFDKRLHKEISNLSEEILCGKYIHWKDDDWIEKDKARVRLINSSSGQQECWPMLVILIVYSLVGHFYVNRKLFFIEEPEAHLFPMSQKKIIDLIGLIYSETKNNNYFLTTHSPYILSSLNNLIISNKSDVKAFRKKSIAFQNVSAYALEDGEIKDIKDYEAEIIDASYIDKVSSCIENEFNQIVEEIS